jgi:hypothetical protein
MFQKSGLYLQFWRVKFEKISISIFTGICQKDRIRQILTVFAVWTHLDPLSVWRLFPDFKPSVATPPLFNCFATFLILLTIDFV